MINMQLLGKAIQIIVFKNIYNFYIKIKVFTKKGKKKTYYTFSSCWIYLLQRAYVKIAFWGMQWTKVIDLGHLRMALL